MKRLFIAIILFLLVSPASGQYDYLCPGDFCTDWIATSSISYPSHYGTYTDDYGATVRRVTDGTGGVDDGEKPFYINGMITVENCDGTLIMGSKLYAPTGAGVWTTADGVLRMTHQGSLGDLPRFVANTKAFWSATDPKVYYMVHGSDNCIYKITIDTDLWTWSDIQLADFNDFAEPLASATSINLNDESSPSWDLRHWPLMVRYTYGAGADSAEYIAWYDKDAGGVDVVDGGSILGTYEVPDNDGVYTVNISPGGNYIFYRTGLTNDLCDAGQCDQAWAKADFTGTVTNANAFLVNNRIGPHFCLAYDDLGNEVVVHVDNTGDAYDLCYWKFNDPGYANRVVIADVTERDNASGVGTGDTHFGVVGRSENTRSWIAYLPTEGTVSDECGNEDTGTSTVTFMRLSATNRLLWKVAHQRNESTTYSNQCFGGGDFDGQYYYWNANWCATQDQNIMRVELPENWWNKVDDEIIFQTNFDSCDDWTVVEGVATISNIFPTYSEGNTDFPSDFPASGTGPRYVGYYESETYMDVNEHNTVYLNDTNRRGTSGKGITHWAEVPEVGHGHEDFNASNGALYITLTDTVGNKEVTGYDEVWVSQWIKYDSNFYEDDEEIKMLHISSYDSTEGLTDWSSGSGDPDAHAPAVIIGRYGLGLTEGGNNKLHNYYFFILYPFADRADFTGNTSADLECGVWRSSSANYYRTDVVLNNGTVNGGWKNSGNYGDGKYYLHEYMVKMNSSPGTADGEFAHYINGQCQMKFTNIPWVNSGSTMVKWNMVKLGGNNDFDDAVAEWECWYAYDDVTISTSRYTGLIPAAKGMGASGASLQ